MKKSKIKHQLEAMTGQFCATFHQCADEILSNPSQIPKEFEGKEANYIGKECMKKVMQLAQK